MERVRVGARELRRRAEQKGRRSNSRGQSASQCLHARISFGAGAPKGQNALSSMRGHPSAAQPSASSSSAAPAQRGMSVRFRTVCGVFLFRSDRVETKAFPCRFLYGRGSCTFGDKCRFSHEPTTTEELERVQAEWVGVQRRYGVEACGSSESGIAGGIDELMEVAGDASNTQEQADAATDQSQSAESLWGGFAFRESLFGAGLR